MFVLNKMQTFFSKNKIGEIIKGDFHSTRHESNQPC
jgi:hypothetical protein